MSENRQMVLARRPVGAVQDDDFEIRTAEVPEPGEGQFVARVCWLAFDPAMRGWLNDVPSYIPPVQIGEVMRARGVGEVIASNNEMFPVGSLAAGTFGWQEYAVGEAGGAMAAYPVPEGIPPTAMLGVLGTTGLTAYFGLLDVGRPQEGDVVLVSGAAGATGSVVGQIAKIKGCRTIGIAGGPDKCAWVKDVAGFDDVIDYKSEDVSRRIRELAPKGVNIYFDNVGGPILQAALGNIARKGRIVVCGGISSGYTMEEPPPGPNNLSMLIVKSASMEGFVVLNYADRFMEGVGQLAQWMMEGKIVYAEDIQEGGLEMAPATLRRLFEGANLGKQLLQIAEPGA